MMKLKVVFVKRWIEVVKHLLILRKYSIITLLHNITKDVLSEKQYAYEFLLRELPFGARQLSCKAELRFR